MLILTALSLASTKRYLSRLSRKFLKILKMRKSLRKNIRLKADDLVPKHITIDDIIATVSYFLNLCEGVGTVDDIDHLGNRRIRSVGELLQNQFRIGFTRMGRVIRERMNIQSQGTEVVTPTALILIRAVGSNDLSAL